MVKHKEAVIELLSEALCDSPLFRFAIPDETRRKPAVREIFRRKLTANQDQFFGHVLADGEGGVALWYPPGFRQSANPLLLIKQGILHAPAILGIGSFITLARNSFFKRHFIRSIVGSVPCWQTDLLAVHPQLRGQGWATRLIRTHLQTLRVPSLGLTQDLPVESVMRHLEFECIDIRQQCPGAPPTKAWLRRPEVDSYVRPVTLIHDLNHFEHEICSDNIAAPSDLRY